MPPKGSNYSQLTREDNARGGRTTIERYGAHRQAGRAREGLIARYLREDGLDPTKMSPDDLEAYRRQVWVRAAHKANEARWRLAAMRKAAAEAAAPTENGGES